MAVINTADDVFSHPQQAESFGGARVLSVATVITIAAADDDGSKFFIAELPGSAIIDEITLEAAAITAGSDYDIGIADTAGNIVSGKGNYFSDALDMSSSTGTVTGPLGKLLRQGMKDVAIADVNKRLYEHAGHVNKALPASGETSKLSKYRLVLTANTIGSAAATVIARVKYRTPGA